MLGREPPTGTESSAQGPISGRMVPFSTSLDFPCYVWLPELSLLPGQIGRICAAPDTRTVTVWDNGCHAGYWRQTKVWLGKQLMAIRHKVRRIEVLIAVVASIGIAAVTAYVCHLKSASEPSQQSPGPQTGSRSKGQIDAGGPGTGEDVSLGRVLGINNPAIPPVTMPVGRPPGEDDTSDLSTPGAAVYSVLTLIDRDATNKLAGCFVEGAAETTGSLYRRYLGQPVELVEVIEDGDSAVVTWNATVHTALSLDGKSWPAGEMITLTTRLVRAGGFWKLVRLHEGSKDDSQ